MAKDTVSCFYVVYLPPVWNLDHLMMSANLDMKGIIIKCSHWLISWSNVYRFIWFYIISFVECRALSRVYVAGADHKKLSQQFHGGYTDVDNRMGLRSEDVHLLHIISLFIMPTWAPITQPSSCVHFS